MKKITYLIVLLFSFNSFAGFMDSRYFEPTVGCLAAGAIGYTSADSEKAMTQGAIFCAVGATVMALVNYHYDQKYGSEFAGRHAFMDNTLRRYEMLDKENVNQKEDMYFQRKQEILPPKILPNGQGIGVRVKERLILKDRKQDFGE